MHNTRTKRFHIVLRWTGNVYKFLGVEKDTTKHQYNDKVVVLAFKSNEMGYYFLCARDGHDVALQVSLLLLSIGRIAE